MQEKHAQFREAVKVWVPIREKSIEDIKAKIESLIKSRRDCSIAKITGSGVSIGGGILAIVGFALTPVTLGGSLALGIGGIAIAGAGGVTAAGASIADTVIQMCENEVKAILDADYENLKPIYELANEMLEIMQETEKMCDGVNKKAILEVFTAIIAPSLLRGGSVGTKIAETVLVGALEIGAATARVAGTTAIRAVAIAGVALSAILIPVDIAFIGFSLKNIIVDKNMSKAAKKLCELLSELEKEKNDIFSKAYPEEQQEGDDL